MGARPIRVLQITSGFAIEGPLGGIERFGVELVQVLPPTIEPTLLGMWAYDTPTEEGWRRRVEAAGVPALMPSHWDGARPLASFRATLGATRRALRGQRFDLIHSHCQFGDALALLLQRPLGARALLRTVHNQVEWPRRPLRRLLLTHGLALTAFAAEVGVSREVVERLDRRPLARLRRRRAALIYNALRLDRFQQGAPAEAREAYRAALGLPEGALLIGSVGRLEPQKGYDTLIEAMERVVADCPAAHLVIAGDGGLAAALREQARHSPAAAHLHLPGPIHPIEPLFEGLDLFVSSSRWEGLATVILEAIAAGVPVVGTATSGTTELIEPDRSGWLAPPDDAPALAAALVEALRDPAERQRRAEAARPILSRFDIRRIAAQYAALYERLASRGP